MADCMLTSSKHTAHELGYVLKGAYHACVKYLTHLNCQVSRAHDRQATPLIIVGPNGQLLRIQLVCPLPAVAGRNTILLLCFK